MLLYYIMGGAFLEIFRDGNITLIKNILNQILSKIIPCFSERAPFFPSFRDFHMFRNVHSPSSQPNLVGKP